MTAVESVPVERSKVASSVVWSAVENGGLALVSLLSLLIYSRFLSAADFGLFSIVLALVELLGVLVSMLFHDALVQRRAASDVHFDSAFTFTLLLSLVLFGACVLLGPMFARVVDSPRAGSVLGWTALCLPFSGVAATVVARARREMEFRALALRSLVGRLSGAAVGILLVIFGAGFWGLVAQQVLIAAVGSLVLWATARAHPRLRFRKAEFFELIGFGGYSVGALFLSFAVKRVFTIMAGVMLGSEAAGYLNLGFRTVDVFWAISATAVTQVALPVLARLQSDPERLKRAYRAALESTCLMLYPCFVGIAVAAPEIVEVLFGTKWLPSAPYVTVLALLIIVQAPRLLISPVLTAVGRPRDSLVGIAVELVVMLALISTIGATSLPLALGIWIAREVAAAPVMATLLRRATSIGFSEQVRGAIAPLITSAIMATAVHTLLETLRPEVGAMFRLACAIPFGVGVFIAAAWIFHRTSLIRVSEFVSTQARRTRERPA